MKKWAILATVVIYICAATLFAQSSSGSASSNTPSPFVFRTTTREVVVELVAADKKNHPVLDFTADDLQVFEVAGRSKTPQKISTFRAIKPSATESPEAQASGLRLTQGGGCASKMDFHYELTYHPTSDAWKSGFHNILVTSSRAGLKLSFRRQYYVGEMARPVKPKVRNSKEWQRELQEAACYRSTTPSSIALSARLVPTGNKDSLKFSLLVLADSLNFISLSDEMRRVELDYGVCTFDEEGNHLQYMSAAAEQVLTEEEYAWSRAHGFPHLIEFPAPQRLALTRFVVRDRETGNIGTFELPANKNADPRSTPHPRDAAGSYGTAIPRPGAMCADVYDLSWGQVNLPDFWKLDPIGTLYTYTLDVPYQEFVDTKGIPGVIHKTDWFGIDYHGTFWIQTPGEYQFELTSDDGAQLWIDSQLVIDLDGTHTAKIENGKIALDKGLHTIHVPYFQGPPTAVALVLRVKRPGENYKLFDLREFAIQAQ